MEDFGGKVRKLKEEVVLVGSNSATLADLDGHGTRDDIAGSEILGLWNEIGVSKGSQNDPIKMGRTVGA